MTLTEKTLAIAALAFGLAAASGCAPAKPSMPTYANDVGPILDAHCARCHNSRGPDGGFLGDPGQKTPTACKFDTFDNAHACAALIPKYIGPTPLQGYFMPPPPASRLNDWEIDVLTQWSNSPLP